MFGWPEMTADGRARLQPPHTRERAKCAIFGQNYGQAGAIRFYGETVTACRRRSAPSELLPLGAAFQTTTGAIIIVMDHDRETLEKMFDQVEEAGAVDHPYAMPYGTTNPSIICRGMKNADARALAQDEKVDLSA